VTLLPPPSTMNAWGVSKVEFWSIGVNMGLSLCNVLIFLDWGWKMVFGFGR